jgi:hypothetical protein
MEGIDQPTPQNVFAWKLDLRGATGPTFEAKWEPNLLGGVLSLSHRAIHAPADVVSGPLYDLLKGPALWPAGEVKLIPYYTFDNREPTTMQVWTPYVQ